MYSIDNNDYYTMMKKLFSLLLLLAAPVAAFGAYGDTSTYFSRIYYGDGKQAVNAIFDFPEDIEVNSNGGFVIADTYNNAIRRIKPSGKVSTLAGTGAYGNKNGRRTTAQFALPKGVALDGSRVFVADTENNAVKRIRNGRVKTVVSGLDNPEDVIVVDGFLYTLDTGNNRLIRTKKKGTGQRTITSNLDNPVKMDASTDGQYLYVADAGSHKLKRVNLNTGGVTTIAGTGEEGFKNGSCSVAKFENIWGVHVYDENTIYVSDGDGFNDYVRKVDLSGDDCTVSTFAADTNMAAINFPRGLTTYNGDLYLAATGIGIIERFSLADADDHSLFAGANRFNVRNRRPALTGNPKFMILSRNRKNIIYSENNRIRKVRRSNRTKSPVIAGNVIDNHNKNDNRSYIGEEARFSDIPSIALSGNGKKVYAVDRNNNRIKEIVIRTGAMTYLTGAGRVNATSGQTNGFQNGNACPNEQERGVSGCAYFDRPTGSVLSASGKFLYVADSSNHAIRRVTVRGTNKGEVTTVAGDGTAGYVNGVGTSARFSAPIGLALNPDGTKLYVADRDNHVIRQIDLATNNVTTLAGAGSNGYLDAELNEAVFSYPEWITVQESTGDIFISEVGGHDIRLIDMSAGVTKLVSGAGTRGFKNGSASEAKFNNPRGLLLLNDRKLLVAELYNDLIRVIDIEGEAPFTDPAPTVSGVSNSTISQSWFPTGTASIGVEGTNFRHGATVTIGNTQASATFVQSATSIAFQFDVNAVGTGTFNITVQNSDSQEYTLINAITINP